MISCIKGKIHHSTQTSVCIMTVSGVGYEVYASTKTLQAINGSNEIELYTYTHVREDALDLYGFLTNNELTLFKLLISVSGIGPKTAMNIMNLGASGVTDAILKADTAYFTQVPKIGTKNAQRIIIELKNKIGSVAELDLSGEMTGETNDIIQALTAMGFSRQESYQMLRSIPETITKFEDKIRFVLKSRGTKDYS